VSREPAAVDYLSVDDLLEIAAGVLDRVDVRDYGLLASSAHRPQTTVFGEEAYPRFTEKVAALFHSIARNHALVDGNKRLAWSAARVFCLLNGVDLRFTVDEAETMVVSVASGALEVAELAALLERHLAEP
jgi:death-on-curing protein